MEMIGIGIVGIGFMGMIHYLATCKVGGQAWSRSVAGTARSW